MAKTDLLRVFMLSITGALVLWLAWPSIDLTFLLFVGFVPFLLVEAEFTDKPEARGKLFIGVVYTGLLLWNAFTTYWVMKATIGGGLMALVANAALMTVPFALFHWMRKRLNWPWGLAFTGLVAFWLSLELLHLTWQLAWPWLNVGNAFAARVEWVQWYEYTGILGGTLWTWLVNGVVFLLIKSRWAKNELGNRHWGLLGALVILVAAPIGLSASFPNTYKSDKQAEVAVIQPNVDPYEDKFNKTAYERQLNNLLDLSRSAISKQTDLVLWPETSLPGNFKESRFYREPRAQRVSQFLSDHPHLSLISGLNTYVTYPGKVTPTARKSNGQYYDVFNAAVALDTAQTPVFYHKSILVPGVERMPYPAFLGFLENLAIELGGTSGSLGSQAEPSVMKVDPDLTVAPVICYESVFGDYVGDFIRKGANVVAVITNDGWWGNTDGYRQHFVYAKLRAIEVRRSIARSANTGISGFIRPNGEVVKATPYWEKRAQVHQLPILNTMTFYARYGDYLGYTGAGVAVLLILLAIARRMGLPLLSGIG